MQRKIYWRNQQKTKRSPGRAPGVCGQWSGHPATGAHFNLPGHSVANLTVTILEKVKKKCDLYRKQRESYFIQKLNTFHEGLNRRL